MTGTMKRVIHSIMVSGLVVFLVTGIMTIFLLMVFPVQASEKRGLLVVMRAGCPVCDVYTPRLKQLAGQGLPVQVVAMDNLPLAAWPDALADRGQADRLGVIGVPTTFVFENNRVHELGAGLIPRATLLRSLKGSASHGTGRMGR